MDDLIKRIEAEIAAIMGPEGDPNEEPLTLYGEAAAALAEAQAEIARMKALIAQEAEFLDIVQAKKLDYESALSSIRRNTCCTGCREAALVASAALGLPVLHYMPLGEFPGGRTFPSDGGGGAGSGPAHFSGESFTVEVGKVPDVPVYAPPGAAKKGDA